LFSHCLLVTKQKRLELQNALSLHHIKLQNEQQTTIIYVKVENREKGKIKRVRRNSECEDEREKN
jgi:hypothetical protein